jgi:DNA excision repair protein ERCC-2
MVARIDLAGKTAVCSVHDLLPEAAARGLGMPGEGLSRLSVGAELHRVVQGRRQSEQRGYEPEVAVDATLEIDGWTLRILGRADGVERGGAAPAAVEEIKTLHFRSELHSPHAHERLERHRWQARIYAFCLFPAGDAAARLLLVDLGGEDERVEEVPWSPAAVRAYLRARLHTLVAAEREREALRERWRAAAAELPFPFPSVRPVQQEAMDAIGASLEAGRHLLLAAPTGVGKTAAALYPAVRQALSSGRRVVFLTAKTLQQQLAVETITRMQRGEWRSIQVRAKAKMCANREVICHEEYCEHARDYGLKLAQRGVLPALLSFAPHLEPERIFAVAHAAEVCPFEVSLELLRECSAVVCDYNYVFDPAIGLFGQVAGGEIEDTYLIIDEAHNLVDRARSYYSPRLSVAAVRQARELLGEHRQKVCRDLDDVLGELEALVLGTVREALGERAGVHQVGLQASDLAALRLDLDAQIAPYFTFKRNVDLWLAEDPVVSVLLSLARLADLAHVGGEELVPLAERTDGPSADEILRIECLDAARFIAPLLASSPGCIAMSATLEPFDFYRDLLGFDTERTDTLALPSPFPPEHRIVVVVDEVDTTYRERGRHYGRIAELVAELAPTGRNALALFPSYAFLREVASRLAIATHRVEIQRGDDSDRLRQDILARLRANREPALLLAVLGGVFAEGVDYPGEMLSEVMVVSPALPQVGPERELLKGYFADRYERGFEYAYLIPGMRRVVQAAGRLIRSEHDRGAIVLICKRFLREPYVSMLPREWTDGAPDNLRALDPVESVRAFFAALPPGP